MSHDWQPPEVKHLGFWDRLGWRMRKHRIGRESERAADAARRTIEEQARQAGIPLRKGQVQ